MGAVNTRLFGRFQNERAGAVRKQNTGTTIGPVYDLRINIRAHDQHTFMFSRLYVFISHAHGVNKSGTNRLDIEGGGIVPDTQAVL